MSEVYKINDVIRCEFLKLPKAMFANEKYRQLSSDAKLAYALLYDRLSLSKLNGWINENDEVYLIYTREELAQALGLTYKKAIAAFRELTEAGLICETRSGRGMANKIYITKIDLSAKQAKDYVKQEAARPAEIARLENSGDTGICEDDSSEAAEELQDMPNGDVLNSQTGISRPAEPAVSDVPISQSNQTEYNKTNKNHTENSQSVSSQQATLNCVSPKCGETFVRFAVAPLPTKRTSLAFCGSPKNRLVFHSDNDGRDDSPYSLDEILESCELETFPEEERKILYDALERLFYSERLKIGNAVLPQEKVRSRMYEITAETLRTAIFKLHRNDKPISNMTAYVMSTIFNCITEEYTLLHIDPYLNALRLPVRRE